MTLDYTINDTRKDGFEKGIMCLMRYIPQYKFTEEELKTLAEYIEFRHNWKTRRG